MKIKSINDVITNSSDETYIVKTPFSAYTASKMFEEYMEEYFPDEWNPNDYTINPVFEDDRDGHISVNWYTMCNLNNSYGILCTIFGAHNVK